MAYVLIACERDTQHVSVDRRMCASSVKESTKESMRAWKTTFTKFTSFKVWIELSVLFLVV